MEYRLWDNDIGQLIGAFATEDAALAVVWTLVDRYGDEIVDDLSLTHIGIDGEREKLVVGRVLVDRAASAHLPVAEEIAKMITPS